MSVTDNSLVLSYSSGSGRGSAAGRFVHLEQIMDDGTEETVTAFDIQQMVAMARNGRSARTYKAPGCAAVIDGYSVLARFDFYAWVSQPDLPYTVSTSLGDISSPVVVRRPTEFSVVFGKTDTVEFDFIIDELLSVRWETECYRSDGTPVECPGLSMDGPTTIRADYPVFGVARVRAIKRGMRHSVTARIVKLVEVPADGNLPDEDSFYSSGAGSFYSYQEWLDRYFRSSIVESANPTPADTVVNLTGLAVDNLRVTVTAHWVPVNASPEHPEDTDSITMEVPACVKDLLQSCWVDTDGDGIPDGPAPGDDGSTEDFVLEICSPAAASAPYNVYVSGCTGKVLAARRDDSDDSSWCGGNV